MPRYGDSTFHGNKNSGRKNKGIEIREAVEEIKEKTKQEALIELANDITKKKLDIINEKFDPNLEDMRAVVMPIVVKGITDKKEMKLNNSNLNIEVDEENINEIVNVLKSNNLI